MRSALVPFLLLTLFGCDTGATPATDAAVPTDAWREPPPEIVTSLGTVRGLRGDGFQAYLGIPYAEPPLGELRFAPPVPIAPWTEPRMAARAPSACTQNGLGLTLGEEDCLYLNVHTPDPLPENAPVMVWIHGGAFIFGEGLQTDRGTAGDILAREHGVVVVSMNYRLGLFGFFTHPSIPEATGNQGIEDQALALRWVHDHIADFGGDPNNVTIFGESAGGMSVCAHMISPGSRGLFHHAISQSGLCDSPMPLPADQAMIAEDALTMLGCTTGDRAACARSASTAAVLAASGSSGDLGAILSADGRPLTPTLDGTILPMQFRDAVASGDIADVPTIIGWNRDEGTLFIGLAEMGGTVADAAAYEAMVTGLAAETGLTTDAIHAAYPLADYDDPGAAISAMVGHVRLACPSRRAARLLADAGMPVYVYRFDQDGAGFQLTLPRDLGAFHSAEIQFVFGHPVGGAFDASEETLHDLMSDAWTRFARTADPNGSLPTWAPFDTTTEPSMTLTTFPAAGTMVDADHCALWDSALP